ncbi:MAG TPA: CocE/NonD family hydrolase [Chthoniobacteraceae bacterium]|nr:CocE/NonD family hydrolase [Chthoniobacteraceae bacterium]
MVSPGRDDNSCNDPLHEFLASYERRFSLAVAAMPVRRPWMAPEREEILSIARRCLGIREEWIPSITTEVTAVSVQRGFSVERLRSVSWAGCHGAAHLYLPDRSDAEGPLPVALLACGHGKGGKQAASYRRMAEHLARHGIAVLVADNIGQGERAAMGHASPVGVFECGLSLQGLIVMETIGWLQWLRGQERFDAARIAAIGNSGGGLLTLFLGALRRDELAIVSSSGYPSTFEFVARKEKKHCHCNLLPHIVGELEMWQLYGCIAPRPLFLFQGAGDPLFPADLFFQTARKVATAYRQRGAADRFQARLFEGAHSWDRTRRSALCEFLCHAFKVPFEEAKIVEADDAPPLGDCFQSWPADAKTADQIAADLSGRTPAATQLAEVFKPEGLPSTPMEHPFLRGDVRQIAAQFEAFLKR